MRAYSLWKWLSSSARTSFIVVSRPVATTVESILPREKKIAFPHDTANHRQTNLAGDGVPVRADREATKGMPIRAALMIISEAN